jgi:predicted ABC-type ATPase
MTKKVTFTFGRFNPPTVGHAKLIKKVIDQSKSTGSEHRIYASKSQDNIKNPIPYKEKIGHLKSLFPGVNIHDDPKAHTAFHIAKNLSDEGYEEVTMVVGQDRVEEFRNQIGKYVRDPKSTDFDPQKHYGFKKFNVVSAGDRDPEAEGVEGMSASKMREFARNDDFESFKQGVPTKNAHIARKIYKSIRKNMQLTEMSRQELAPDLDSFVDFASDHLGLESLPNIRYKDHDDEYASFGGYRPDAKEITITTKNRHPMDVFRTLAHELVHHKQNLEGRIKDVAKEGSTGSEIENEANSLAGIIMRNYAQKNPKAFSMESMTEEVVLQEGIHDPATFKAVFLAGGPGSGKDYILKQTLAGNGLTEINSDIALEFLMKKNNLDLKMPDHEQEKRDLLRNRSKNITKEKNKLALQNRLGLIINGTAADVAKLADIKKYLEDIGYSTMMIYVDTDDKISAERNTERGLSGGRSVPEKIRKEKWEEAYAAKPVLQSMFGKENFVVVDNSTDLRKADGETVKKKMDEFKTIFKKVKSFASAPVESDEAKKWFESEKAKKGIVDHKPAKAHTYGSKPKEKAPEKKKTEPQKSVSTNKVSDKTKPTGSKVERPQPEVPQAERQNPVSNSIMDKARALGLTYYGFGRFGKDHTTTHIERNGELTLKKKIAESKALNTEFEKFISEEGGAGEEGTPELVNNYRSMTPGEPKTKRTKIRINRRDDSRGIGPTATGTGPTLTIYENDVRAWMESAKTIQRFKSKYGSQYESKLQETANKLLAASKPITEERKPKSLKSFLKPKNQ